MIKLKHYDDGKQKWQSHEISIIEENFYNAKYDIYSHNPFDIIGYGETENEALENFKNKFFYVMDELRAFENMLIQDPDVLK